MHRSIPLTDLQAQHEVLSEALLAATSRVIRSGRFVMGAEVEAFESEVGAALGVPHAIGVSSGSDALLMALLALGIGPGDEVVTTPFSFFATAGAIARAGARPRFVDIEPNTFNLDVANIEPVLTAQTRAVLVVHVFGQVADLRALRGLCDRHGLALVEDAAQALGASRDGLHAGTVGDIGCFSFFPTKTLGGLGDGGLVTTPDPQLAQWVRMARVHGARTRHLHEFVGGNFRLDALQAALLRVKLPHVRAYIAARRHNAWHYGRLFATAALPPAALIAPDGSDPGHVFSQYTVRAGDRDGLRRHLQAMRIGCAVYYPRPLHQQPCFAGLGDRPGSLPVAEQACREVLSLPMYPELSLPDLTYVADQVVRWAATFS